MKINTLKVLAASVLLASVAYAAPIAQNAGTSGIKYHILAAGARVDDIDCTDNANDVCVVNESGQSIYFNVLPFSQSGSIPYTTPPSWVDVYNTGDVNNNITTYINNTQYNVPDHSILQITTAPDLTGGKNKLIVTVIHR